MPQRMIMKMKNILIESVITNGTYGDTRCFNAHSNKRMAEFLGIELPEFNEFSPCANEKYKDCKVEVSPGVDVRFCYHLKDGEWVDYHPQACVSPLKMLEAAGVEYVLVNQFVELPAIDKADIEKAREAIYILPGSLHDYIDDMPAPMPVTLKFSKLKGVMVSDPLGVLPTNVF